MAAVLKTAGRKPRGFESHPLRHSIHARNGPLEGSSGPLTVRRLPQSLPQSDRGQHLVHPVGSVALLRLHDVRVDVHGGGDRAMPERLHAGEGQGTGEGAEVICLERPPLVPRAGARKPPGLTGSDLCRRNPRNRSRAFRDVARVAAAGSTRERRGSDPDIPPTSRGALASSQPGCALHPAAPRSTPTNGVSRLP
jgi:hypothetical protein